MRMGDGLMASREVVHRGVACVDVNTSDFWRQFAFEGKDKHKRHASGQVSCKRRRRINIMIHTQYIDCSMGRLFATHSFVHSHAEYVRTVTIAHN